MLMWHFFNAKIDFLIIILMCRQPCQLFLLVIGKDLNVTC